MVNEWTREDLPSEDHLLTVFRAGDPAKASAYERGGIIAVLDAVLDHLRINPGPSAREERVAVGDLRRLRRAHEIVEGERDQAREERDEYRDGMHAAQRHHEKVEEHLVARVEAAEARTAPAVTKAEVGKVVRESLVLHGVAPERVTDAVWSLLSGSDPAVHVVRESDLPEVWRDDMGGWRAGRSSYSSTTPEHLRSHIPTLLGFIANRESVARAIEAGQATDPVTEKARELYGVVHPDGFNDDWHNVTSETQDAYRRLARHVLGQEAKR